MFVGHAALAFAAKTRCTKTSLGTLLFATFGLDLIWPWLVLGGIEQVRIDPGNTAFTALAFDYYPWSHSLLMAALWGGLAGAAYYGARRERGAAWMVGALVVSHWLLDWISHRPDMPLWPGAGSPLLGLGLWNSIPATLVVEGALFALGVGIYLRVTQARDRIGSVALWVLLAVLAFAWASGPFSPPPSSVKEVAGFGVVAGPLFGIWAIWVDRHRETATLAN